MTVKKCKHACHPEALAEGSLTRFERDSSQIAFAQNDGKKKKAAFTLAEGTTYVDMLPTHAKEISITVDTRGGHEGLSTFLRLFCC